MGMKNHELVPEPLVRVLSGLRCGESGVHKVIQGLVRHRLLAYTTAGAGRSSAVTTDGYRLTSLGYDFQALRALVSSEQLSSVGCKIGVGKESDVYLAQDADGCQVVAKFHRLGRTSFRAVKSKRDYHGKRAHASWLYLSRLSATREFSALTTLHESKLFDVPQPLAHNRHVVVMQYIDNSLPLYRLHADQIAHPLKLYEAAKRQLEQLASCGLVHGDFNEHNILVDDDEKLWIIDLPQCISTRHAEGPEQYARDAECLMAFFGERWRLADQMEEPADLEDIAREEAPEMQLDALMKAPGWQLADAAQVEEEEEEKEDNEDNENDSADNDEEEDEVEVVKKASTSRQVIDKCSADAIKRRVVWEEARSRARQGERHVKKQIRAQGKVRARREAQEDPFF